MRLRGYYSIPQVRNSGAAPQNLCTWHLATAAGVTAVLRRLKVSYSQGSGAGTVPPAVHAYRTTATLPTGGNVIAGAVHDRHWRSAANLSVVCLSAAASDDSALTAITATATGGPLGHLSGGNVATGAGMVTGERDDVIYQDDNVGAVLYPGDGIVVQVTRSPTAAAGSEWFTVDAVIDEYLP